MPVVHDVWDLRGTPEQNRVIEQTLERVDFPWHWLKEGLRNSVGRETIPVEWDDLSRYAQSNEAESHKHKARLHSSRAHSDEEDFHVIEYRERVLGLAWYSGKVTMEQTLVNEADLAGEVFMSEGAHMVDFFYMDDPLRIAVWNAFHSDHQDVDPETALQDGAEVHHGHSWFDVGGYYSWVGEAFMGGFVAAFSDLPVTIAFDHPTTPEVAAEIRVAFGLGDTTPEEPTPDVEEPQVPDEPTAPKEPGADEPVVPEDNEAPFFGLDNSRVFHDSHKGIGQQVVWQSYEAAVNDGRRPCKVCKPRQSAAQTLGTHG